MLNDLVPEEFTKWIDAVKSRPKQEYVVPNLAAFQDRWKTWWLSIQPAWRTAKKPWPPARRGPFSDLSSLNVSEKYGLFIAIGSLSLWGNSLYGRSSKDAGTACKEFYQAVDDVLWVFNQMKRFRL